MSELSGSIGTSMLHGFGPGMYPVWNGSRMQVIRSGSADLKRNCLCWTAHKASYSTKSANVCYQISSEEIAQSV